MEYRDIVLFLYEDGNYYESEKIKKFIDFINLSLNYIPQRKYMRDYIEKNRWICRTRYTELWQYENNRGFKGTTDSKYPGV